MPQRITVPADTTLMRRLAQIETASQQAGTATAQATRCVISIMVLNLMSNRQPAGPRVPAVHRARQLIDTALNQFRSS
jgi:hypothetical protein